MDVPSRHAHELYLYKASRTQPAASCKPASPFTLSMPNREPTKKNVELGVSHGAVFFRRVFLACGCDVGLSVQDTAQYLPRRR